MNDQRWILQAIDACRPGSKDLDRPEFHSLAVRVREDPRIAELYRRVQRLDRRIATTFQAAAVPGGLEQRILRGLEASAAMRPVANSGRAVGHAAPWRRRVMGIVAAAAAVLVIVGAWWIWSSGPRITTDNIWTMAARWCEGVDPQSWRPMATAPDGYPTSPRVLARPFGWQPVRPALGGGGVLYDLSGPAGPPALLLVIRSRVEGLPTRPPGQPLWTQNRSMAAWQSGPLLFVLILDGPPERYRRYVDNRPPPLA